jgi:hypothetical protein
MLYFRDLRAKEATKLLANCEPKTAKPQRNVMTSALVRIISSTACNR